MAVTEDTRSISSGPKNDGSANFTSVFLTNQKFIDFNSKKHVQHVSPAKEVFSLVKLRSLE